MSFRSKDIPADIKHRMAMIGQADHSADIRKKVKPSHTPGKMNKWEGLYADRLRVRMATGEVLRFYFEAVKFRLAEGCWYCPDFLVQLADGSWEIHEVKGYWRDDAKVKCKVQAEAFPFPLIIVSKGKGMTVWQYEQVRARTITRGVQP